MSTPPFPMRKILHTKAHRFLYFSLFSSISAATTYFFFYTVPRFRKYEHFYETYDPYQRMREICSYPTKFLHTCPSELAKKAEEKGITIGELNDLYASPQNSSNSLVEASSVEVETV